MSCRSVAISALSFWTIESGTRVVDGVEGEELEVVLTPRIDSAGVVSVGSDIAGLAIWDCSTVDVMFLPSGCISGRGPLWGANSLASSRMRSISTVIDGVLSALMCHTGTLANLHKAKTMHWKG